MKPSEAREVLGVADDAELSAITSAYRKLALQNHPDKNREDENATATFQHIGEAYACLTDPGYDQERDFDDDDDDYYYDDDDEDDFGEEFGFDPFAFFAFMRQGGVQVNLSGGNVVFGVPFGPYGAGPGQQQNQQQQPQFRPPPQQHAGPFSSSYGGQEREHDTESEWWKEREKKKAEKKKREREETARKEAEYLRKQHAKAARREKVRKRQEEAEASRAKRAAESEAAKRKTEEDSRREKEARARSSQQVIRQKIRDQHARRRRAFEACGAGNLRALQALLEEEQKDVEPMYHVKLNDCLIYQDVTFATLLHMTVAGEGVDEELRKGRCDVATWLLAQPTSGPYGAPDLSKHDQRGLTVLHSAVDAGDVPLLNLLLEKKVKSPSCGVDLEKTCLENGWTPLMYAATGGRVSMMKALLAAGAQVTTLTDITVCEYGGVPQTALDMVKEQLAKGGLEKQGEIMLRAAKMRLENATAELLKARQAREAARQAQEKEKQKAAAEQAAREAVEQALLEKKKKALADKKSRALDEERKQQQQQLQQQRQQSQQKDTGDKGQLTQSNEGQGKKKAKGKKKKKKSAAVLEAEAVKASRNAAGKSDFGLSAYTSSHQTPSHAHSAAMGGGYSYSPQVSRASDADKRDRERALETRKRLSQKHLGVRDAGNGTQSGLKSSASTAPAATGGGGMNLDRYMSLLQTTGIDMNNGDLDGPSVPVQGTVDSSAVYPPAQHQQGRIESQLGVRNEVARSFEPSLAQAPVSLAEAEHSLPPPPPPPAASSNSGPRCRCGNEDLSCFAPADEPGAVYCLGVGSSGCGETVQVDMAPGYTLFGGGAAKYQHQPAVAPQEAPLQSEAIPSYGGWGDGGSSASPDWGDTGQPQHSGGGGGWETGADYGEYKQPQQPADERWSYTPTPTSLSQEHQQQPQHQYPQQQPQYHQQQQQQQQSQQQYPQEHQQQQPQQRQPQHQYSQQQQQHQAPQEKKKGGRQQPRQKQKTRGGSRRAAAPAPAAAAPPASPAPEAQSHSTFPPLGNGSTPRSPRDEIEVVDQLFAQLLEMGFDIDQCNAATQVCGFELEPVLTYLMG